VGFFVWELVKVVLTVALLLVAPRVVVDLNWLALVAGFVVTIKMYWLVMALNKWQRHRPPRF
jgi:ATP synthase protein I